MLRDFIVLDSGWKPKDIYEVLNKKEEYSVI